MADSTLRDPLGRTITLHDRTWFGHILRGHPQIKGDRALVERAVIVPTEIHFSTSDGNCRVDYGEQLPGAQMIAVIADVVQGLVKTAYRTRKPKPGGVEWVR